MFKKLFLVFVVLTAVAFAASCVSGERPLPTDAMKADSPPACPDAGPDGVTHGGEVAAD